MSAFRTRLIASAAAIGLRVYTTGDPKESVMFYRIPAPNKVEVVERFDSGREALLWLREQAP